MTSLAQVIDALRPIGDGWRGEVPAEWLQGRTAYGGLSAALALHAAQRSEPDLPPLRSAQISFIGPLSGEVTVSDFVREGFSSQTMAIWDADGRRVAEQMQSVAVFA